MKSILKVLTLGLSLATLYACYYATQPSQNTSSSNVFGDQAPPSSSVLVGPADPRQMLHVVVGMQRNQSGLESYFKQISDPASPNYKQFLSVNAIASQFGASAATQQSLLAYMQGQGITMTTDPTGAFAEGDASIGVLSRVFSAAFSVYSLGGSDTFVALSGVPTLPPALQGVVTEVLGLLSTQTTLQQTGNDSAASKSGLSAQLTSNQIGQQGSPTSSGTRSGCPDALAKNGFTPNQFLSAYGMDSLRSRGVSGQGVYLALIETASFSQSAIDQFTQCYGIANPTRPQVITLGNTPGEAVEPMLDIELVLSVAPQLSGLLVFEKDLKSYGDWVSLYAAPLNTKYTGGRKIDIISTSIGNCELQWTAAAVRLMEHVLLTAATAGISTFASAGDSGSSTCYHHDKTTTSQSAEYPASSAYVTAVGGTNLALNTANQITGEGVWNDTLFPSPYNTHLAGGGGGFSVFVNLPFWQTGTGISSKTRMTPDVALFADAFPGYAIYTDLKGWSDDGGTSAATPLMASSVALLQQMASAKGQTLGPAFLWIYKLTNSSAYQTAFGDVIVGNNDVFHVGCCNAGPGYDTASGWGSPNFSILATLLIGP
jgi:kumamolisin